MNAVAQFLGIIGGVLIIVSYYLLISKRLQANQGRYHAINLLAAILLLFSLLFKPNLGSILIEVFFIILACLGIKKADRF